MYSLYLTRDLWTKIETLTSNRLEKFSHIPTNKFKNNYKSNLIGSIGEIGLYYILLKNNINPKPIYEHHHDLDVDLKYNQINIEIKTRDHNSNIKYGSRVSLDQYIKYKHTKNNLIYVFMSYHYHTNTVSIYSWNKSLDFYKTILDCNTYNKQSNISRQPVKLIKFCKIKNFKKHLIRTKMPKPKSATEIKIESLYKTKVTYVEKKLKTNKVTNNIQLHKLSKQLFKTRFKGVYPFDKIPKLKQNQSCIFNLDKHTEPGSHWCALYKSPTNYLVYDSFSRKVLKGKKYLNSDLSDKEQKVSEDNCGQRCIAWLMILYKHGYAKALLI